MRTANNSNNRQKKKFDRFVLGLVNVTLFTAQIQPLLDVDTTAVFPLRQIYAETEYDFSEQGRILNDSADRLLTTIQASSQSYHQQHRILNNNSYSHIHKNAGKNKVQGDQQSKFTKAKTKVSSYKFADPFVEMDENCNVSNLQHLKNQDKKQTKAKVVKLDLKEIIRPQYRRQLQVKTHRVNSQQIENAPLQSMRRKDQIWNQTETHLSFASSSEQEDIPLLKNKKKAQIICIIDQRSKSPKVEGKKHKNMLSNISSISRNYQTQTDQSFQTDLNCMGLLSDKESQSHSSRKSSSIVEGFLNDRKNYEQSYLNNSKQQNNKVAPKNSHKYDQSSSAEIQQEQPWQCDEQQLEQELKQINARLSHRGYQTQRFKTEVQTFHDNHNQVQNCSTPQQARICKETFKDRQYNIPDGRKKHTKTVRLSLTPIKSKSPIRNCSKKQIRQISIIKTPIIEAPTDNRKQKYKPYRVNCLIESEQSQKQEQLFECSKWKKPNRGLITVQIQKFAKDN